MYECDCEECQYFEEHPFAKETMDDWCNKHETFIKDIADCVNFENKGGKNMVLSIENKKVENFDDENRENIELQIREIISNIVSEDLDKLNTIRLGIYREFYSITQYQQELYNNNYEMDVLDALVDNAYDNGLSIVEPKEFLSGDVDELMNKLDYIRDQDLVYNNLSQKENDLAYNIHNALYAYDLDKALELLK